VAVAVAVAVAGHSGRAGRGGHLAAVDWQTKGMGHRGFGHGHGHGDGHVYDLALHPGRGLTKLRATTPMPGKAPTWGNRW
jgi:hypothetical protein